MMAYRQEIARIYRYDGILGFTSGYRPMVVRDIISFGLHFTFYDFFKRSYTTIKDEKYLHTDPPLLWRMASSGVSGAISWSIAFPFDSLKLRMQTKDVNPKLSIIKAFSEVNRKEGLKVIYRGVHI
jgi:Mitochondrial carrier protein